MTTTTTPEIDDYVSRCQPFLSDLSPDQQKQLSEDIRQIVGEVAMELAGAPDDLVGPPLRFVAELRIAAGLLPPRAAQQTTPPPPRSAPRVLIAWLRQTATPWARRLARELRPTWWVARGVGLTFLFGGFTNRYMDGQGLIPDINNSNVLGLMGMMAAVVASVQFGRKELGQTPLVRVMWLAASLAAVLSLSYAVDSLRYPTYYNTTSASFDQGYEAGYMESQSMFNDELQTPVTTTIEIQSGATVAAGSGEPGAAVNLEALPPILFLGTGTGESVAGPVYVTGDALDIVDQLSHAGVSAQLVQIEVFSQRHDFADWDTARAFLVDL